MTNFQQVVNTPKIAIFKYCPGHSKPRLTKVGRGFSFGLRDRKRRPEQIPKRRRRNIAATQRWKGIPDKSFYNLLKEGSARLRTDQTKTAGNLTIACCLRRLPS